MSSNSLFLLRVGFAVKPEFPEKRVFQQNRPIADFGVRAFIANFCPVCGHIVFLGETVPDLFSGMY